MALFFENLYVWNPRGTSYTNPTQNGKMKILLGDFHLEQIDGTFV
jgi:hypothetical protein